MIIHSKLYELRQIMIQHFITKYGMYIQYKWKVLWIALTDSFCPNLDCYLRVICIVSACLSDKRLGKQSFRIGNTLKSKYVQITFKIWCAMVYGNSSTWATIILSITDTWKKSIAVHRMTECYWSMLKDEEKKLENKVPRKVWPYCPTNHKQRSESKNDISWRRLSNITAAHTA